MPGSEFPQQCRRRVRLAVVCITAAVLAGGRVRGAGPSPQNAVPANAAPIFKQYCFQCHGSAVATAGVNLEKLTATASVAENYQTWERVVTALEQKHMPPKGMPQPSDEQRAQAALWVRSRLDGFVKSHAGDPGHVTVRRLTSGEYNYTIHDLTGLDLDLGIDASNDSVGGEGFTNFGDVQFMQDSNLERYLDAAKQVADHAVVGAGPLEFYSDPGKSGFEMSAIHRIKDIDTKFGFRTVSGEGGISFGLEKYTKALFAAWEFRHRAALGKPTATLASLAAEEGVTARFVQHLWSVLNRRDLAYPSSEMAARFQKLPVPTSDAKASAAAGRAACETLQKFVTSWPSWLFARGDAAVGGAGDESPLIISEKSLKVEGTHHFLFNRGGRGAPGGRGTATAAPKTAKLYLNIEPVNPAAKGKPVVIWRNPTVAFRSTVFGRGATAAAAGNADGAADPNAAQPNQAQIAAAGRGRGAAPPRIPLQSVATPAFAQKIHFGTSPDGASVAPGDFASESSVAIEVQLPDGAVAFDFQADAEVAPIATRSSASSLPTAKTEARAAFPSARFWVIRRARDTRRSSPACCNWRSFCRRIRIANRLPRTKTRFPNPSTAPTTCPSTMPSTTT